MQLKEKKSERYERVLNKVTAMVQAMYPGFSLWSILLPTIMMNIPTYQGIAPRKNPTMNLEEYQTQAL